MIEKLDYYDLLGAMVPGTLLVSVIAVLFPQLIPIASAAGFPEAFAVVALVVLAFFLGQMVQAAGSMAEPALHMTWGGRPSDSVFRAGLPGYLPQQSGVRICTRLRGALGGAPDERSLFLYAMQRAESCKDGRAGRFNCLYAYHRGIVVLMVLCFALLTLSARWGAAATWSNGTVLSTVAVMALTLLLAWHRTKQRGMYYVREVLLSAERTLDDRSPTDDGGSNGAQHRP